VSNIIRVQADTNYLYGMVTVGAAFYQLKNNLLSLYDEREAVAIAHELLEHITGMGKTDRLIYKDRALDADQLASYKKAIPLLQAGVPLQQVTGNAWFMGRRYYVNQHVLIPRPETEELVQWIQESVPRASSLAILDIGTGSGCIPISLKMGLPAVQVTSCDISSEALKVAHANALSLKADVDLLLLDFLDTDARSKLGKYDIIVSNPPYIPASEADQLHTNVRDHEPALALFVPDSDALVFYRAIADFGKGHLRAGGSIFCELDAGHAEATKSLFEEAGYKNMELRKDIHGNQRMLRAGF